MGAQVCVVKKYDYYTRLSNLHFFNFLSSGFNIFGESDCRPHLLAIRMYKNDSCFKS